MRWKPSSSWLSMFAYIIWNSRLSLDRCSLFLSKPFLKKTMSLSLSSSMNFCFWVFFLILPRITLSYSVFLALFYLEGESLPPIDLGRSYASISKNGPTSYSYSLLYQKNFLHSWTSKRS